MSTKFAVSLCDSNTRANSILDCYLDTCTKFDCVDVLGGSRYNNNYYKNYIRTVEDLPILRSQFLLSYNMHMMSCYVEGAEELPKNVAFYQNFGEVDNVVAVANGTITNKEYLAIQYECSLGQCTQELLCNLYNSAMKKGLREDSIPSMIRDIEGTCFSFVIFDKNLNQMFVYNRGDSLYMRNVPGMEVVISSDILPVGGTYPHFNFHRLSSNCAIKIDTKTMFVQNIPANSNIFSFGKNVLIDSSKALLFTEACDMEYYTANCLVSDRNIYNGTDIQTVYFGFDTDIDSLVVDKINKLRKSIGGNNTKIPVHIKYSFDNIYKSESEAIDEMNAAINEGSESITSNDSTSSDDKDGVKNDTSKKKVHKKVAAPNLRQSTSFINKKINFIAVSLVNYAIENGSGAIFIPNTNRHNNRLLNTIKDIINSQTLSPLYVYSILDQYNTMDLIRYLMVCKEIRDLDKVLINCDRESLGIGYNDKNDKIYTYNVTSNYNCDVISAFSKCGLVNPFSDRYVGREKINDVLANTNLKSDKLFDNQMKVSFIDNISSITKNYVEYQRKIQSF